MIAHKRVLVAMSGGVDSSVAALLLQRQGYEIVGVHMKLWDFAEVGGDIHRDGRCCTVDSVTDCRFVCDRIGAPFYVLDLSDHFRASVIEDFIAEYRAGRTPNPCVRCNTDVKWGGLLRKADELGCDFISTGHYSFVEEDDGRWFIRKGVDGTRDQSYVLWGLSQVALARTLMPLGGLLKSQVRQIARESGLRTADNAESREICFVADDDYHRFLREYEGRRGRRFEPGEIVHLDGRVLGRHQGTEFYTVGQRKGLGVSHPTPLYVHHVDPINHMVVVGDDADLFSDTLVAEHINWMSRIPSGPFEAEVKIRYLHAAAPATVEPGPDGRVTVCFREAQRAITPGQSVVFYEGDRVVGGGLIA